MKIRVVHIVNTTFGLVFSGHTHYLFSLLSGWKDKNISLDIFGTPAKPLNMNSGNREYQLPNGILWSKSKRQTRLRRVLWSIELLVLLFKRRNEYDIIHYHSLNWGSLISVVLLRILKKKVVFSMSLMGNDNPSYIKKQPRGRLQLLFLRKFDGFIGLSPALVNDAVDNNLKNVICLPNFMTIPKLDEKLSHKSRAIEKTNARKNLSVPQNGKIILFIGSIIKRKGVDILIETFLRLSKKHKNLMLLLVGPMTKNETNGIDENFVNQLQKKIEFAGLTNRVIWAGMVKDQSDLLNYYRSADVFVLPTRNEGSPNVLAEAMASYLPVVISNLPGITDEIITNNINGFLVEKDDVESFTFVLDELITNDNKCNEIGVNGKKTALSLFGFDSYCQRIRKFYLDLYSDENII